MSRRNGGSAEIRRLPVKRRRIELTGDWEGWWLDVRTNPPTGPWLDYAVEITTLDEEDPQSSYRLVKVMLEMLKLVVLEWNFVDEDGAPLPIDRLAHLPAELIAATWKEVTDAAKTPLESSTS